MPRQHRARLDTDLALFLVAVVLFGLVVLGLGLLGVGRMTYRNGK